jgi:formate-dependent nitrite reductase membrane component NrfD
MRKSQQRMMQRPGTEYAFQAEWITGRGKLLWLAMVMGALGGGAFIVSSVLNLLTGDDFRIVSLTGLLIVAAGKGVFHLAFLGRPERFWRAFARPHSSWISRGIYILSTFTLLAGAYLAASWLGASAGLVTGLQWAATLMAAFLVTYDGFLLRDAKAIAFWQTPILPILFASAAALAGVGVSFLLIPYFIEVRESTMRMVEFIDRLILIGLVGLVAAYLWTMHEAESAARRSVLELLRGQVSGMFLATCLIAIIVPGCIAVYGMFAHVPLHVLTAAGLAEIAGEFAIKFVVLRAGVYTPLIPQSAQAGGDALSALHLPKLTANPRPLTRA